MRKTKPSAETKIKVVILCCSGRFQAYLANQLNQNFELAGIVLCDTLSSKQGIWARMRHLTRYLNLRVLFQYISSRIYLPKYEAKTEEKLRQHYPEFIQGQSFPDNTPTIQVSNINDPTAVTFVGDLKPDVICVNGTNLLREPMLSIANNIPLGIINLHTGLSPYSRGGNCNLFMLLENNPQLVGATIHYVNKGIDSGDIIQTVRPPMSAYDPYEYIEAKVFISGIEAMIRSISNIKHGKAPRVKQWASGKLFLKRTGYQYNPYIRLLVNRKIADGLIQRYLDNQEALDRDVKLIP